MKGVTRQTKFYVVTEEYDFGVGELDSYVTFFRSKRKANKYFKWLGKNTPVACASSGEYTYAQIEDELAPHMKKNNYKIRVFF